MRPVNDQAYFLVGPTAAGKTAVAQWIAEREGSEILSADSMLVYRGMDIGTAKPTAGERGRVRYHGIDLVSPDCRFSVWDYRQAALDALADAAARRKSVIVVGGTGLYVKSLTHGLDEIPGPDPDVRARWERVLERDGVAALQAALRERSPDMLASLDDAQNGRRLVRALELDAAGVRALPRGWEADPTPMPALDMPAERLHSRIEQRVHDMYGRGLVDEVEALSQSCGTLSATALQAIGYAEVLAWQEGRCSREEAVAETIRRTRRLARRQRTWFRHQANVRWIEVGESIEDAAAAVQAHWREWGPGKCVGM